MDADAITIPIRVVFIKYILVSTRSRRELRAIDPMCT